jgi:DNA-binding NarL/FixJ family response regulator
MTDRIRVLIVDDDALVRTGLSMMLSQFDDLEVAGAVADGDEVVAATNQHRPDVVLMDIRMPQVDGLTATEQLRARREPPEVIILTTFDTDRHIRRAMRAGSSTPRRPRSRRPSGWSRRASRCSRRTCSAG